MRLLDRYREWRFRRWASGHCYICDRPTMIRVTARKFGEPPLTLYSCLDHKPLLIEYMSVYLRHDPTEAPHD